MHGSHSYVDFLIAISDQSFSDFVERAEPTMKEVCNNIADTKHFSQINFAGLEKWLVMDPENTLFPHTVDRFSRPRDHLEFLIMAYQEGSNDLEYAALHSFVLQLLGHASEEYLRKILCTYEKTLTKFFRRVQVETVFTCFRIFELMMHITSADIEGREKLAAVWNATGPQFDKQRSSLCQGITQWLAHGLYQRMPLHQVRKPIYLNEGTNLLRSRNSRLRVSAKHAHAHEDYQHCVPHRQRRLSH